MSNEEYLKLLLSKECTPRMIMKKGVSHKVYKYRRFIDESKNEELQWKESLAGEMYFSKPTKFNSNDKNDCIINYDEERINEQLRSLFPENNNVYILYWNKIKKIINSIRENIKIGCFTTVDPLCNKMWNKLEFGGEGRGYCIEYELTEIDYPEPIIYLPVCYISKHIDMTELLLEYIMGSYNNEEDKMKNLLVANGYNFALTKLNDYIEEAEHRIIVVKNRWASYFDIDHESKRDFSKNMKAIYFGPEYRSLDENNTYRDGAIQICKKKKLPFYELVYVGGHLKEKQIIV